MIRGLLAEFGIGVLQSRGATWHRRSRSTLLLRSGGCVISFWFAFGGGVVRLLAKIALRCLASEAHPFGERASTNETLLCAASPLLSRVRLSKRRKRSPTPRLQVRRQQSATTRRVAAEGQLGGLVDSSLNGEGGGGSGCVAHFAFRGFGAFSFTPGSSPFVCRGAKSVLNLLEQGNAETCSRAEPVARPTEKLPRGLDERPYCSAAVRAPRKAARPMAAFTNPSASACSVNFLMNAAPCSRPWGNAMAWRSRPSSQREPWH